MVVHPSLWTRVLWSLAGVKVIPINPVGGEKAVVAASLFVFIFIHFFLRGTEAADKLYLDNFIMLMSRTRAE